MRSVQLPEALYDEMQRRASRAGFDSVDAYITDILQNDDPNAGDVGHLFTPEVIAELDRISASIQAGSETYSSSEVAAHFEARRQAWRANRPS